VADGYKRKLIEVALPLEAINRESAREKSIRHGHPSTLHLWWARRPLAACRAVLFAQLVDDPSAHPDRFPTEEAQSKERQRLFDLIERLVVWENSGNEALLRQAHDEIAASFEGQPPVILEPFAGGGSIPLEAQRLGLEVHASDLNPVAVLINKAMVEIPPRWAGRPPVFPGATGSRLGDWPHATGLAEDVRRYGTWMRDQAQKRLGHLYPQATLPDGSGASVIAWIWARAVTCPNPACRTETPLVNSFTLSSRRGRTAHVKPVVKESRISYEVESSVAPSFSGTVSRNGARCLACDGAMPLSYVRAEGVAGRLGSHLLAVVAEGARRRIYLPPTSQHVQAADIAPPEDVPDVELATNPRAITAPNYGLRTQADLYTPRQLHLLVTLTNLVDEVVDRARADGAEDDYANDLAVYLTLLIGRVANRNSSQSFWDTGAGNVQQVFARNALPMIWVYAEANPFSDSSGNVIGQLSYLTGALERVPAGAPASAEQRDAVNLSESNGSVVVATDPPYYDNVPYADLSDFFYVWQRRALASRLPELYSTLVTPKAPELIAEPARTGSRLSAARFFEDGLSRFFSEATRVQDPRYPFTIFYAFKQAETDAQGTASTGWETMLQALLNAGASVTATWPVRTELAGGLRELGRNALASSVVLACRPRHASAEATTRRGFLQALQAELPAALRELQQGSIAPVDLAQAAIGPGMAVFTRYRTVVEADGAPMTVRTALALINQALDEVLSEQEGDFDADTRFCVKWFSQFGWDEAEFGHADQLSRSTNTSVEGLVRGGIFWARAGRARLLAPDDLSPDWDPLTDVRVSGWELVVRLAKALTEKGVDEAARLMASASQRIDLETSKELAYLLYSLCEKRGWTDSALLFNGLGTSWSDLAAAARGSGQKSGSAQDAFTFDDVEDEG
jgi:putative DNA methylase